MLCYGKYVYFLCRYITTIGICSKNIKWESYLRRANSQNKIEECNIVIAIKFFAIMVKYLLTTSFKCDETLKRT